MITKEMIESLLHTKTHKQIAEEFNCSHNWISKLCRKYGLHVNKHMHNFKDITGLKFGQLLVIGISEVKSKKAKWECICDCGNITVVSGTHLRMNNTVSCGCAKLKRTFWTGHGDISGKIWGEIKNKACTRNIEFNLSIEFAWELYLKQNRLCALTNWPIIFVNGKSSLKRTASLDRIDNRVGYLEHNVQWVHKDVNHSKWVFDQDYFIKLCKAVASNK